MSRPTNSVRYLVDPNSPESINFIDRIAQEKQSNQNGMHEISLEHEITLPNGQQSNQNVIQNKFNENPPSSLTILIRGFQTIFKTFKWKMPWIIIIMSVIQVKIQAIDFCLLKIVNLFMKYFCFYP